MTRDDTRNITRPVTVGLVVFSLAVFVPSDAQERASRAGNPAQTASYTVVADVERPVGLAFGPSGDLYVAQPQAGKVTRVKPDGTRITLLQGLKEPRDPGLRLLGKSVCGRDRDRPHSEAHGQALEPTSMMDA